MVISTLTTAVAKHVTKKTTFSRSLDVHKLNYFFAKH